MRASKQSKMEIPPMPHHIKKPCMIWRLTVFKTKWINKMSHRKHLRNKRKRRMLPHKPMLISNSRSNSSCNSQGLCKTRLPRAFKSLPICLSIHKWLSLRHPQSNCLTQTVPISWLTPPSPIEIDSTSLHISLEDSSSNSLNSNSPHLSYNSNSSSSSQDMSIRGTMQTLLSSQSKIEK